MGMPVGGARRAVWVLGLALCVLAAAAALPAQAGQRYQLGMPVSPPNVIHIPPYVARDKGFFAQEGLDVEIVEFAEGLQVLRGVLAGRLTSGWTSGQAAILAASRGEAKIFYAFAPRLPSAFVTRTDITRPEQLRGRKIGVQEIGGFAETLSRAVLSLAGLTPNDVQYVTISSAGEVAMFAMGQIDTAVLHRDQVYAAMERSRDMHVLLNFREVLPNWFYGGVVTTTAGMENQRDAHNRFVRAMIRAVRWMYQPSNRGELVDVTARYTGVSRSIAERTVQAYLEGELWAPNSGLSPAILEWSADEAVRAGRLRPEQRVPFERMVDLGPTQQALQSLGWWAGL